MPEAAAVLKISPETLRRWRQLRAASPAIRLPNRQLRFRRGDLTTWIRTHYERENEPL